MTDDGILLDDAEPLPDLMERCASPGNLQRPSDETITSAYHDFAAEDTKRKENTIAIYIEVMGHEGAVFPLRESRHFNATDAALSG
jgi:hypothetical protein